MIVHAHQAVFPNGMRNVSQLILDYYYPGLVLCTTAAPLKRIELRVRLVEHAVASRMASRARRAGSVPSASLL